MNDLNSPHAPPLCGPFDKLRTDGVGQEGPDLVWGGPALRSVMPLLRGLATSFL